MYKQTAGKVAEILLVEDHPGDVRLAMEALKEIDLPNNMNVVNDGFEALKYLKQEGKYFKSPKPDIVLLDLALPKMTGHEVLARIRSDKKIGNIPVAILSSSQNEDDILLAYKNKANCYIVKQPDTRELARNIRGFWGFTLLARKNIKTQI